jgi:hypothetical protein
MTGTGTASITPSNSPTPTGTDTPSNTPSVTGTGTASITPSNSPTPTGTDTPSKTPIFEPLKNETGQLLSSLDSASQQSDSNTFVSSPQGTGILSGIGAIVALASIGIGYTLYRKLRKPPAKQPILHNLQPIMIQRTNNPVQVVVSPSANNINKGTYATTLMTYRSPQLTSVQSQSSTASISPRISPELKSIGNPRANMPSDYSMYKNTNIKSMVRSPEAVEAREKISFQATHIRSGRHLM